MMTRLKMASKSLAAQATQPWLRAQQVMVSLLKMVTKYQGAQAVHP